jgi:hypothetical protein
MAEIYSLSESEGRRAWCVVWDDTDLSPPYQGIKGGVMNRMLDLICHSGGIFAVADTIFNRSQVVLAPKSPESSAGNVIGY